MSENTRMEFPDVVTLREAAGDASSEAYENAGFVQRLTRLLLHEGDQRATGWVVGLTGPWGSGKTTALNNVKASLERALAAGREKASLKSQSKGASSNPVLVVEFNPWVHSGTSEMLMAFFDSILREADAAKAVYPGLKGFQGVLSKARKLASGLTGLLNATGLELKQIGDDLLGASVEDTRAEIEVGLKNANASVIVLIDEIDRLTDSEIRTLAQVVKSVADFDRFSYLLAYDPERVAAALAPGREKRDGHHYLEKIVQVQTRLPRIEDSALVGMTRDQIYRVLVSYEAFLDPDDMEKFRDDLEGVLTLLVPRVLTNPRDGRRLATAFEARLPLVGRDVDLADLLRYCALECKVPVLSERLQPLLKILTLDGVREHRRTMLHVPEPDILIKGVLADFDDDPELIELLRYLFPTLRGRATFDIVRDDRCLCYSASLATLLNFEAVAGTASFDALENAVLRDPNRLPVLLEAARKAGWLRQAALRLRTVLMKHCSLPTKYQQKVWRILGKYLDRPFKPTGDNDWSNWPDITHILIRAATHGGCFRSGLSEAFVRNLISEGQIHLPATLLHSHMELYGDPFALAKRTPFQPVLTVEQTTKLLECYKETATYLRRPAGAWVLRGIHPIWVACTDLVSASRPVAARMKERAGGRYLASQLSAPSDREALYGILILAVRTRLDEQKTKRKIKEIGLKDFLGGDDLLTAWLENGVDDPGYGSPVAVANRYLNELTSRG